MIIGYETTTDSGTAMHAISQPKIQGPGPLRVVHHVPLEVKCTYSLDLLEPKDEKRRGPIESVHQQAPAPRQSIICHEIQWQRRGSSTSRFARRTDWRVLSERPAIRGTAETTTARTTPRPLLLAPPRLAFSRKLPSLYKKHKLILSPTPPCFTIYIHCPYSGPLSFSAR